MTRAGFLLSLGSLAGAARMLVTGEASDGYKSLFNGRDLSQWMGDRLPWKVDTPPTLADSPALPRRSARLPVCGSQ
jgi:hypothetical protein